MFFQAHLAWYSPDFQKYVASAADTVQDEQSLIAQMQETFPLLPSDRASLEQAPRISPLFTIATDKDQALL